MKFGILVIFFNFEPAREFPIVILRRNKICESKYVNNHTMHSPAKRKRKKTLKKILAKEQRAQPV